MSTLPQSGNLGTSSLSGSGNSVAKNPGQSFQTISNPGTTAIVVASTQSQLTLSIGATKVTLPAPKIPAQLEAGKAVSFQIKSDSSPNLLDISAKYLQQRLPLTPQQSELVIQNILQNPGSLAGKLEVKGTVLSVQANNIQVKVNGETLNIAVKNPQQYQPDQPIKLSLTTGTLGWETQINTGTTQEVSRLSIQEAAKILRNHSGQSPITLSEKGRQQLQPLLGNLTESQVSGIFEKVQFKNDDKRLIALLGFRKAPVASVSLDSKQQQHLANALQLRSNSEINFNNPVNDKPQTIRGQAQNNAATTAQAPTYKVTPQRPQTDVNPDIAKTISASQKQFNELKITPPVQEIRLSEQKHKAPQSAEDNASPAEKKVNLRNSAQQILQTLKSFTSSSTEDIQQTVVQNLQKVLSSLETKVETAGKPAMMRPQLQDLLHSLKQLSEQTTKTDPGLSNKLSLAIDEIYKNIGVSDNLKSHIRTQTQHLHNDGNQTTLPDALLIKQLLQTPAMPINPVSLVTPASTGIVAGLINLLQISLAARLTRNNNDLNEKISNTISQLISPSAKSALPQKAGNTGLKELSQIEQKHNLVKLLGDLLNQHSRQKVQNTERSLQGQEAFYYVLPFRQGEQNTPPELLITREKPEEQEQQSSKVDNKAWLLTMKLSVGDSGELLAKTKVNEDSIHVDFYTSNETLKTTVLEHLPVLLKRFKQLGLNLEVGRCERGHIPEHLANNPYQILQTRA